MDDHDASYYRVGNTPGWKPIEVEQVPPPEDAGILPFLFGLACGILGGVMAVVVMG